jgi:hypothetical protein
VSARLVDAAGTAHAPASGRPRIVSLVPSITELLCDLGLAYAVVGRTGFCIHPRERVRGIAKVGGTKDVDLGKLRALVPTHVIVNVDENRKEDAQAITGFVPSVVVTHPLGPRDNLELYRLVGGIFGREREAEALCAQFEAEYAALQSAAGAFAPERVLYLIWKSPGCGLARHLRVAHARPGQLGDRPGRGGNRYPKIGLDDDAVEGAAVVLLSSEPYRFLPSHVEELRGSLPGRAVALIDGEMTAWYGSRAIKALGYLARFRANLDSRQARA